MFKMITNVLQCPDYDLCQKVSGQRQHSTTGYIYTREQWDPEVIESRRKKKKEAHKEGKGDEEGEEEEEQEEEEVTSQYHILVLLTFMRITLNEQIAWITENSRYYIK